MKDDPSKLPDQVRGEVIRHYEEKYKDNLELWDDVVANLGQKASTQRHLRRNRAFAVGKKVDNRDDLEYEEFFKNVPGGDKVITLDSNKDLPEDWKDQLDDWKKKEYTRPMTELFSDGRGRGGAESRATTGEGEEEERGRCSKRSNPRRPPGGEDESPGFPSRILIFTTALLLALCRFQKWSVDGTFKVELE